MKENLLSIRNLNVTFPSKYGVVRAVRDVSFDLEENVVTAIVGESGCGKSVTARALMGLSAMTGAKVGEESRILFEEENILDYSAKQWQEYRGTKCSMVFQDAMAALNPTMTVGRQLMETLVVHRICDKAESRKRAIEMLQMVNIPDPVRRMEQYPHEFSGGMRQRVMIAIALIAHPRLLIADEPTTALDVTIQAEILNLLKKLQKQLNMSVLLVSHDLGVVFNIAQRILVMYAGHIVESGRLEDIFQNPKHPYTSALLGTIPQLEGEGKQRLLAIEGSPPNLILDEEGCPFAPRCRYCMKICQKQHPEMTEVGEKHFSGCWLNHAYAGECSAKFLEGRLL